MIKPIIATLLLAFSFQAHARPISCEGLFLWSMYSPDVKLTSTAKIFKENNGPKSFVYDSRWFIDKLIKEGGLQKITEGDPKKDHVPFLQDLLIEAHREFYEALLLEHSELQLSSAIESVPYKIQRKSNVANLFGLKKMAAAFITNYREETEQNRVKNLISKRDLATGLVQYYLNMTTALNQRIASQSVTLDFYNKYTYLMSMLFTLRTRRHYLENPHWIFERLKPSYDDRFITTRLPDGHVAINTLAELDFYDFIELWPQIMPEGIITKLKLTYDNSLGDGGNFKVHDKAHSESFVAAFSALSEAEKQQFVKIMKFLTTYRSQLTEQEQIIFGASFFSPLHEIYRLKNILTYFEKPAVPSSTENSLFNGNIQFRIHAEVIYPRLINQNDLGQGYKMENLSKEDFASEAVRILEKITDAYHQSQENAAISP